VVFEWTDQQTDPLPAAT